MKPGTKNILLIGGAGIALYILMKGDLLGGGPSDIFGGKEAKGTVAGTWTGSGGDSGGSTPSDFGGTTKKEATGYTPTSFQVEPSQALLDQYYQRNIEPTLFTPKGTGGTPLSFATEMKAVNTAAAGYGNSGVYVTQPPGRVGSSTAAIPFGVGDDYSAPTKKVASDPLSVILAAQNRYYGAPTTKNTNPLLNFTPVNQAASKGYYSGGTSTKKSVSAGISASPGSQTPTTRFGVTGM